MVVTGKQLAVLRVIDRYAREEGYPPTLREIEEELQGSVGLTKVAERLSSLAHKGLVRRKPEKSRSVWLTEDGKALLLCPQVAGLCDQVISRVTWTAFRVESVQLKEGCGDCGREAA